MTFASLGEVFAELDAEAQAQAHQVFVQLVRPGEGAEDTRRLATSAEAGEENWGLVQHLADKRLVVTGRDAAGLVAAVVQMIDPASVVGVVSFVAYIIFYFTLGWKVYSLSRAW